MWMVAGVNKKLDGPLGSYSVLTDRYLSHYFNNPSIKQHLIGMGLIRKDGSIIPESVYRRKHQDRLRKQMANQALASAIVKKTIDLEKLRKSQIERHIDELAKVETVERIRSARQRRRNTSAPAGFRNCFPNGSVSILYHGRGKSAPPPNRKLRRKVKKIDKSMDLDLSRSYSATNLNVEDFDFDDVPKNDDGSSLVSNNSEIYEISNYHSSRPKSAHPRKRTKPFVPSSFEAIERFYAQANNALLLKAVSPYLQPLLSASMENVARKRKSFSARGQRSQPVTIRDLLEWSDESEKFLTRRKKINKKIKSTSVQSLSSSSLSKSCHLTLRFLGSQLLKSIDPGSRTPEIVVKQQHCGGTPILVYKSNHSAGDLLTFASRRHRGYTFSVTIFVDGICDLRLSACCEYRYQVGAKLGGAQGHFSLFKVDGGKPCYKCQAEQHLVIERPKHPLPSPNSKKPGTSLEKEPPKARAKSAAPFQRKLTRHTSVQNISKADPISIDASNTENKEADFGSNEVVNEVATLPEQPKPEVQESRDVFKSASHFVPEQITGKPDEVPEVNEEEEESSIESVEEDINVSGSNNPSYNIGDSTRADSPEDAIPGEFETAELTHEFSDEDEEDEDEDDDDEDDEDEEEELENDDNVFDQSQVATEDEKAEAPPPAKGKTTTVVIRPDSAMNRISLPKSHWGARDPSLEPPSYSSDDEDLRNKGITLVTVDVHANPSRSNSQMDHVTAPHS